MPAFDLVALGHACTDLVARLGALPARNHKLEVDAIRASGGGPAATAALTAARFGKKTAFLGQIGSGELASIALRELVAEGIDVSGVEVHPVEGGRVAVVLVDEQTAERTIVFTRSGLPGLDPRRVPAELIAAAGLLLVDDLDLPAAIRAAEIARQSGVPVLLDAGTPRPGIDKLLPLADIVITSAHFLPDRFGIDDPLAGLARLRELGPQVVGVTLGERGSIVCDRQTVCEQPAFAVDAVDTTGAGDVFHGAFAYGVLEGWELERSVRFASAAAALSCTREGAQPAVPTRAAVEELLAASR